MQNWSVWIDPEEFGIPRVVYFDKLFDDREGLQIFLTGDSAFNMKILFTDVVLCYRKLDEGSYLRALYWLKEHYGGDFLRKTCFFIAYESEFLKWFIEDSLGIYENNIPTYVIFTNDEVMEIISYNPPTIEII